MKKKLILTLATIVLLAGCSAEQEPELVRMHKLMRLENIQQADLDSIRIIDITSRIRPGDTGSVTIKGKPGTRYSITATYKLKRATISESVRAFEGKDSGNDGKVTWTWKVDANTEPGTYPIAISGGGQTLRTAYTVVR